GSPGDDKTGQNQLDNESSPPSNPHYLPIKAQLLVEILRKHRPNAWESTLREMEIFISRELKVIASSSAPRDAAMPYIRASDRHGNENEDVLRDYDESINRLAIGHLDRVAKERNLIVRRKAGAAAAPLISFNLKLLADPPPIEIYLIS